MSYEEDNTEEFGVKNVWENSSTLDTLHTRRGTLVEMIGRPKWGTVCYMNNSVQSCTIDEKLYHETLVHPVMSCIADPKRVCIIGGGEGATAREVLRWSTVKHVDMFEWDEDIVNLFKNKYTQWGKEAWQDPRLHLHFEDIFEVIEDFVPEPKYDVIIIDLFEPVEKNRSQWSCLLDKLSTWLIPTGSMVMYAGMRNILIDKQPYEYLKEILMDSYEWHGITIPKMERTNEITPYRIWIPSFSGESMFLLLTPPNSCPNFNNLELIRSHITEPIWNSYKTLNW